MKPLLPLAFSLLILTSPTQAQVSDSSIGTEDVHAAATSVALSPAQSDLQRASEFTGGFEPATIRTDEGLVIWPVPAVDELNVYISGGSKGNLPFEVVDMTGRVKMRGAVQGGSASKIDISGLSTGDHQLRVVDMSGLRSILFTK